MLINSAEAINYESFLVVEKDLENWTHSMQGKKLGKFSSIIGTIPENYESSVRDNLKPVSTIIINENLDAELPILASSPTDLNPPISVTPSTKINNTPTTLPTNYTSIQNPVKSTDVSIDPSQS